MEYSDVVEALNTITPVVHRTPLFHSRTLSQWCGHEVFLKMENLQKTGAFKIRGAYNMIAHLSEEERKRGVVAASAGNHAQGVALSATLFGIPVTVVMPEGAPLAKAEATKGYGANIVLKGLTYDDAYEYAMQRCRTTGATFVHAFDHPHTIAGQGTIGLEMLQQCTDLDAVVVPIGGGGLISGMGVALKAVNPRIRLIGVQPLGAPSTLLSLQNGQRTTLSATGTIADGLAVRTPGKLTFALMQRYVDEVVTVNDDEIIETIWTLLERQKILVEGAGAAGMAALLYRKVQGLEGKKVGVVISGGNMDINKLLNLRRPTDKRLEVRAQPALKLIHAHS